MVSEWLPKSQYHGHTSVRRLPAEKGKMRNEEERSEREGGR